MQGITYIWVGDRWVYLAVIFDLYRRRIVSWSMSNSPDATLCTPIEAKFSELKSDDNPETALI